MAYTKNIPNGGDLVSSSQPIIKDNFNAIDSGSSTPDTAGDYGFSRNHVTLTNTTNGGLHHLVDFYQDIATPATLAGTASLYTKTISGLSQLFFANTPGSPVEMQLSGGSATIAATGKVVFPNGLTLIWGSGSAVSSGFTVKNFGLSGFANNCFVIFGNADGSVESIGFTLLSKTQYKVKSLNDASYFYLAIGN